MKAKTMKTNHDRRRQKPTMRILHRTMRAVVCALWVLTTASGAHAAASLIVLSWLPGDNFNYNTTGVSGDGSVVVGTSGYDTSGYGYFLRAFPWTAGSGMVSLGGYGSSASGVSADGSVIVGTSNYVAFRWTAGTGMVGLGYLPGGTYSYANGISADGSVIVGTSYSASGNQAFRWTAGSGMVGLGHLPGNTNSSASGVSADGSVIVGTSSSGSVGQAFRWTAGSGMQSLRDVLVTNGLTFDPAELLIASGISADGNTIVGSDYYSDSDDGMAFGFVATLPRLIGVSPVLSINSWSSAALHLVLSWSTNYTGCTLQSSTDLGSTNWTNCASPTVSGASFVVTNSMSAGAQFFRLKR